MLERKDLLTQGRGVIFDFATEKPFIYSVIFYSCGLFLGSVIYKYSGGKLIDSVLELKEREFFELFYGNICIYLSAFLVTLFLGFCIIGYSVVNAVPFVIGVSSGMKISCYLINFGAKGLGFSLLMLVPFEALFITVICYVITESSALSKSLINLTRAESADRISVRESVKKYSIYGFMIILCALISAALNSLLFGIITI
jgi:hypothetical protein